MLRKIITTAENNLIIQLPQSYVNRKLEILVLPYDDDSVNDITYWSKDELDDLSKQNFVNIADVKEDYSTW